MLDSPPPSTLSSAINIADLSDWENTTNSIAMDLADIVLDRSSGSSGYDWGYNAGSLVDVTQHHFQYFISRLGGMRANLWLRLAEAILDSYINKPDGMMLFIREDPIVIETVMYGYVDAYNTLTAPAHTTQRLDRVSLNKLITFLLIGSMVKDGPPSENFKNIHKLYKDFAADNFVKFNEPLPLDRPIFSKALATLQDEYSEFAVYLRAVAKDGSGPINVTVGKRSISQKLGFSRKAPNNPKTSPAPGTAMTSLRKRTLPPTQPSFATMQSEQPTYQCPSAGSVQS
jgi:hypothetical protein